MKRERPINAMTQKAMLGDPSTFAHPSVLARLPLSGLSSPANGVQRSQGSARRQKKSITDEEEISVIVP